MRVAADGRLLLSVNLHLESSENTGSSVGHSPAWLLCVDRHHALGSRFVLSTT